jgi:hypothetical protein
MVDKGLDPGGAAEHGFQIRKRGKRIEIGMHESEIFDIRQVSRLGPKANFRAGKLLRERVAPGLGVADMFVEINDEQRHDRPLIYPTVSVAGIPLFSYMLALPGIHAVGGGGFRTAPFSLFVQASVRKQVIRQQRVGSTPERSGRIATSARIPAYPFLIRVDILAVEQSMAFESAKECTVDKKGISRDARGPCPDRGRSSTGSEFPITVRQEDPGWTPGRRERWRRRVFRHVTDPTVRASRHAAEAIVSARAAARSQSYGKANNSAPH